MQKETKTAIVKAALEYLELHEMSQKTLADQAGINVSYLHSMLAGETSVKVKDRPVAIAPKWFAILATYIGFVYQKEYWPFVATNEFVQIINVLDFAKANCFTNVIICDTGIGKTNAVERFSTRHPQHTYVITASRLHKITEILTELSEKLNLTPAYMNSAKLRKVIAKLRDVRMSGGTPIVIIDEAENLTLPVLQMLKALYDGIKLWCGVVLIGTPQLVAKLDKMEENNVDGMPQFCRRFKAGRRMINRVNDYKPFFEALDIADAALQKTVTRLARNYGELRDYLEPALREADRLGEPLTETLFRQFHYLPHYNQ